MRGHQTRHDAQVIGITADLYFAGGLLTTRIERILRALTHMDPVSETGGRSYAANEVTQLLNTSSNMAHEEYWCVFGPSSL